MTWAKLTAFTFTLRFRSDCSFPCTIYLTPSLSVISSRPNLLPPQYITGHSKKNVIARQSTNATSNDRVYCYVHRRCTSHGFVSLGNPPTFLQLNQNPCLLQKLKLTFVNGLDGVAAVAVKCHLPPPVTVVSLRAPATFSRYLRPPVSPRLGKEVNRQRLQIRCHRRSCLMLQNPSKEPVCPMAQSSSVISARPRSLPTSSNRTFISVLYLHICSMHATARVIYQNPG